MNIDKMSHQRSVMAFKGAMNIKYHVSVKKNTTQIIESCAEDHDQCCISIFM
jgi:hypothetical protein